MYGKGQSLLGESDTGKTLNLFLENGRGYPDAVMERIAGNMDRVCHPFVLVRAAELIQKLEGSRGNFWLGRLGEWLSKDTQQIIKDLMEIYPEHCDGPDMDRLLGLLEPLVTMVENANYVTIRRSLDNPKVRWPAYPEHLVGWIRDENVNIDVAADLFRLVTIMSSSADFRNKCLYFPGGDIRPLLSELSNREDGVPLQWYALYGDCIIDKDVVVVESCAV